MARLTTSLHVAQTAIGVTLWVIAQGLLILSVVYDEHLYALWGLFAGLIGAVVILWLIVGVAADGVKAEFHQQHLNDEQICQTFAQALRDARVQQADDELTHI